MDGKTRTLIYDVEADNLKEQVTRIWCVTIDDGVEILHYGPNDVEKGVRQLHGQHIVCHNQINYDLVVIQKFYPWFKPSKVDDTFILSSLFEPDRFGHGLADWGKQFGVPKPEHEDWSQYSDEMRHRNIEDVRITRLVWEHLLKERNSGWNWEDAIRLEYKIAGIHAKQEEIGVAFDVEAANRLHQSISAEVAELDTRILRNIPPKIVKVGETMSKPFKMDGSLNERTKQWLKESYPDHLTE